ncbi:MAG: glycosyltransferase family 2 protein [Nitrospiraceae bacterium]|nr:glycosyltransferase family 2 protein [Nitrospiraceae bacterium]
MNIAVVVTTYNRPDALSAVLNGFRDQRDQEFELIVADDGSTVDTRAVVERFRGDCPFPVRHVWQEDQGFRAAAVRNRAVASTTADYIIFVDGDCVPSMDFVRAHRRLAERGFFLGANRVLLSPALTQEVLAMGLSIHRWRWRDWVQAWFTRKVNRVLPLMTLPDGGFRKWHPGRWQGIKTCNLSLWRSDLVRVNGLDEAYEGWGLEDSDLVIRLINAGLRHKSARFAAPVFHLWHPEQNRTGLPGNKARLEALLQSKASRSSMGFDQYGRPDEGRTGLRKV